MSMPQGGNLKYGAILFAVCLASAAALSFVYKFTLPAVKKTAEDNLLMLKREVLPDAVSFRVSADGDKSVETGLDAYGKPVGKTATAYARGYGGDVAVIVGTDNSGAVTGVKILSHKETPGLGTKALDTSYLAQYVGKKQKSLALKKDFPNTGRIDSVTGATMTSRAVAAAVAAAAGKISGDDVHGVTQATPKKAK